MRRLPEPPFQAALLLPRWLGDAVMASALIKPLARLSGRPVEIWGREALAPIFRPGDSISHFRIYEGRGRHRGLRGGWRFRRAEGVSRADVVWVIPDSLSSALAARFTGVRNRIGRAWEGRSPLLSRSIPFLRRDHSRHWIEEKADLLRPFMKDDELADLMPKLSLGHDEEGFEKWLGDENLTPGNFIVLAPGAAYGPAKRWWGFEEFALLLPAELDVLLVGSRGEKGELESLAGRLAEKKRSSKVYGGTLDLERLARLFRAAHCTVSNDSGAMHLAAAAGSMVIGIFLSTDPTWTAPRGLRSTFFSSSAPCCPCFFRECPLEEMVCQESIHPACVAMSFDFKKAETP